MGGIFFRSYYNMEDRLQEMKLAARAASLRTRPDQKLLEAKGGCLCTQEIRMSTLLTEWEKNFFCASFTSTVDTSAIYSIQAYQPCCCKDGWSFISTADDIKPVFLILGEADKSFRTIVDNVIVTPDSEPTETIYTGPAKGCCAEINYEITNHKIVFKKDVSCCMCIPAGSFYDAIWLPTISNYSLTHPYCDCCPCCISIITAKTSHGTRSIPLEFPADKAKEVYAKLKEVHKRRMQNQFASAAASIGNGQVMVPAPAQPTSFVALPSNVVMTRGDTDDNKTQK